MIGQRSFLDKRFSYGNLLKVLSKGLYTNPFSVIREYVQNSYDAVREYEEKTNTKVEKPITIRILKPSIIIEDKGTGMTINSLHKFRKIGYSEKSSEKSVGLWGIGKLSGITVAEKLIVTTSPFNVNKKFTLLFDSQAMLDELNKLKDKTKMPTLDELVHKHTTITEAYEDKNKHYTIVEIHKIRNEAKELLNQNKLIDYVRKHLPIPFDPDNKFSQEINDNIKIFVKDYDYRLIFVNDIPVFKIFPKNLKNPQFREIHNARGNRIIAYAWFCQNKFAGQINKEEGFTGLVYKYKNFKVGTNHLVRSDLWKTGSHLAYWFFGEIHICDDFLEPTSERDNFQPNKNRSEFYKQAQIYLTKILERQARGFSGRENYKKIVNRTAEEIFDIESQLKQKEIPIELAKEKEFAIRTLLENLRERQVPKNLPKKILRTAKDIEKRGDEMIKQLDPSFSQESKYNIEKELNLSPELARLHKIVTDVIKEIFQDDVKMAEFLIKKIHERMRSEFKK